MQNYFADEIGVLSPNQLQVDELYAGEVHAHPTDLVLNMVIFMVPTEIQVHLAQEL